MPKLACRVPTFTLTPFAPEFQAVVPARTSLPTPVLVRSPVLVARTLGSVRMPAASATSMVAPVVPNSIAWLAERVSELPGVKASVPPLTETTLVALALPRFASVENCNLPSVTETAPLNVFAAERATTPEVVLAMPAVPVRIPETVPERSRKSEEDARLPVVPVMVPESKVTTPTVSA